MIETNMGRPFDSQQSTPQRRQAIARLLHSLWTSGGVDESGLAPVIFDGRIDALGAYVACTDFNEDSFSSTHKSKIERRHCRTLDYVTFVSEYMLTNQPVLIDGLTEHWRASQEWVYTDESDVTRPDLERLAKLFGNDTAPVHVQARGGFTTNRPKKEDMTLSDYAEWWEMHSQDKGEELLYLKDWKFVAVHGEYEAYEWPEYFLDDWLNGAMGHAYKFVYLGPSGTSTRLHADVLRSFSWSTNVCGRKRWYMIPPDCTHLLYDCFGTRLASHLHADIQDGLDVFFPGLAEARRHAIEVVQEGGETIFVPSGWHHTVENLEPTLSINHNWVNGANIYWSWKKLRAELESSHNLRLNCDSSNNADSQGDELGAYNAQVEDDLLLLWYVLSKKAQSAMASSTKDTDNSVLDMSAIHPILEDIRELIDQGKDHGLTTRCVCNIGDLIANLEGFLK
jgi:hypothetical protein